MSTSEDNDSINRLVRSFLSELWDHQRQSKSNQIQNSILNEIQSITFLSKS